MPSIDTLCSAALRKLQAGNLPGAEADCLELLNTHPANSEARHILGLVYRQQGDTGRARIQLSKAISLSPDIAPYHNSLGNLYLENGDINAALRAFQQATLLDPCLSEAYFSTGLIMQQAGQQEAAAEAYRNALKTKPDHPEANFNLGAIYHVAGETDKAAACYRKALETNPGNFQLEYNLAHIYLEHEPARAEIHLRHVLETRPDFLDAGFYLGLSLIAQGKQQEALNCFAAIVRLKPGHTDANNNIGIILMGRGDYRNAISAFHKALLQEPDNARIHFNIGTSFKEDKQYPDAIRSFQQAMKLQPDFPKAHVELCRCRQIICDWSDGHCTTEKLAALTRSCLETRGDSPVYPFDALSLPFTAELQRKIATSHARTVKQNAGTADRYTARHMDFSGPRLRIGYLSQKFNDHAGAHLIASLFGLHDREKFEIFAYSIGADDHSSYRQRIMQGCDHFIDVEDMDFAAIANRIHADKINILVDLGVYNTFSRTEILALHPAPVQVSYLGYPGTSGSDFYDYILTDRTVTPPDQQQWFTEKFAYLPHCYQVNDHLLDLPENIPDRAACGLPLKGFVFCSFNNSYKIEPVMFDVWMNILARVPDSVLWLLDHTPETTSNLCREAGARGIDSERLVFAEKLPKDLHLARHQHADLFLDTYIYNAHTTASDSLRVGVPVLTTPGTTFASRVAASLLHAVNLPEMIATDLSEYTEIAVKYSTNMEYTGNIKDKLSTSLNSAPLFNTHLYARHLESAFRQMWGIYTSGSDARQIRVKPED